jgi:serine/threonine protein kinase
VFITQHHEVKVLDFGIATAIGRADKGGADATVFNARDLGAMTPAYASLEQLRGQPPDPRDDVYAFACVAYELLSGKHPYGRLSAEKAQELKLIAKPINGLHNRQWKALQRGLAFKLEERSASMDEFLASARPPSKWLRGAWAAGLVAAAVTGANVYLNLIAPPAPPPPVALALSPEQQGKVDDLLELAAIHFDVGYLTAPTGSNALWAYQEVLKIDPYNAKAADGIKKIADAEEQAAWESYEKGDRAQSLKNVLEGLEAEPHHEGLLRLKSKLEK